MDFGEVMGVVLPIVYVVLGVALVWFVIELVITVRKTRTTVDKMKEQLDPTLESVQRITKSLEPAMDKVDPLVDRVSLTVDAANLEIMRLDQILEDVSDITDSASNAVGAVEAATNAPMEIMNNVTSKVREKLKSKHASDESVALGEAKAQHWQACRTKATMSRAAPPPRPRRTTTMRPSRSSPMTSLSGLRTSRMLPRATIPPRSARSWYPWPPIPMSRWRRRADGSSWYGPR